MRTSYVVHTHESPHIFNNAIKHANCQLFVTCCFVTFSTHLYKCSENTNQCGHFILVRPNLEYTWTRNEACTKTMLIAV